jgi:hypothetical protein
VIHEAIAEYVGSAVEGLAYSEAAEGNVFIDKLPTTPDRAVCVYATPGPEADSKLPYDPVTFQVVVRGEAMAWPLVTWTRVRDVLHGLRNVTLPGGELMIWCIATQSSPFRLGEDENGRPQYSANYRAEVLHASSQRPA